MDFLVQRYLPNTANEAHRNSGSWEDVAVVKDLKADEAEEAAATALNGVPPLDGAQPDRVRVVKWEHVEEFDTVPGPPVLSKQEKAERGTGE